MKVDSINAYKEEFREHLRITQDYNELYKYESLANFSKHWDLSALDLGAMYERSFHSDLSARLWGGSQNSAKSMMLQFIEKDKEFVRSMFRDLFNESKDLAMRINRFKLHCDELLGELQSAGKQDSHHFHTDEEVFLYLAFNAPETYPLFQYAHFNIMMNRLENRNVPEEWEVDRYYKLCKGLYTLLSRDGDLVQMHIEKRGQYYDQPTMIMVNDFISICSQGPKV